MRSRSDRMMARFAVFVLLAFAAVAAGGEPQPPAPCMSAPETPCDVAMPPPPLDAAQRLAMFGPETSPGYVVTGAVRRMEWDRSAPAHEFAERIALMREPVILTNSPPTTEWAANTAWTDDYLLKHVSTLTQIYRSKSRTFVYENENRKSMDGLNFLPHVVGPTNSEPITLPLKSFLAEIEKPQPDVFHYYSRDLTRADNFVRLLKDVTPRDYFKLGGTHTSHNDQTLLWMGGNGTVAHTHFDTNNNFYYQIRGYKRFVLSAPDQYRALYIHPHLHVCDRQSMLNFSTPDLSRFPLYGTATAVIADLSPGDLLYLPPMWFHRVFAKSKSISVNVWSDAYENMIVDRLNTEAVPSFLTKIAATKPAHETKIGHKDATRVLVYFIRSVMKKVLGLETAKERNLFIREALLQTRYGAFSKLLKCDKASFKPERCPTAGHVDVSLKAEVRAPLNAAVRLFDAFKSTPNIKRVSRAAIEILFVDYLERLGFFHVGVENVCAFYRCVALAGSWDVATTVHDQAAAAAAAAAAAGEAPPVAATTGTRGVGLASRLPLPDESKPNRVNFDDTPLPRNLKNAK